MPGTTHASSSSIDTGTPTLPDGLDPSRTVWFGNGEAYHTDLPWGPGCPDKIGRTDEHTLAEAAEEGKRPCKVCNPEDYRQLATDGGEPVEVDAVDRVKDAHYDLLALAVAASGGDVEDVEEHADEVRDAVDEVENLIAKDGGRA